MRRLGHAVLAAGLLLGALAAGADPLPSWSDGEVKSRILAFVDKVTKEGGPDFVAPEDRIATFDNDGCLWVEKPTYTQVFFVQERLRSLAPDHPEWKTTQPYRAALEGDLATLGKLGVPAIVELMGVTHAGMTQEAFESEAARFFAEARHPRWKKRFSELVYQPQLELMEHLRAHGFLVFIVTGGGRDFVREISEPVYGVPRHMVTGSALQTRFEITDGVARLLRLPEAVVPINDKTGKPVQIERDIGRRPVLAVGNSDGDLPMLQYSAGRTGPSLQVLVHHDDAEREYAYDHGAEAALAAAAENQWVVVSMKADFARIFPGDE